jgi:hypothetical protein
MLAITMPRIPAYARAPDCKEGSYREHNLRISQVLPMVLRQLIKTPAHT